MYNLPESFSQGVLLGEPQYVQITLCSLQLLKLFSSSCLVWVGVGKKKKERRTFKSVKMLRKVCFSLDLATTFRYSQFPTNTWVPKEESYVLNMPF
jgi:hypothetical protein